MGIWQKSNDALGAIIAIVAMVLLCVVGVVSVIEYRHYRETMPEPESRSLEELLIEAKEHAMRNAALSSEDRESSDR